MTYMFGLELGGSPLTVRSDGTWRQVHPDSPTGVSGYTEEGTWCDMDGRLMFRDETSEGWDSAVLEVQQAYDEWKRKMEKVVNKVIMS